MVVFLDLAIGFLAGSILLFFLGYWHLPGSKHMIPAGGVTWKMWHPDGEESEVLEHWHNENNKGCWKLKELEPGQIFMADLVDDVLALPGSWTGSQPFVSRYTRANNEMPWGNPHYAAYFAEKARERLEKKNMQAIAFYEMLGDHMAEVSEQQNEETRRSVEKEKSVFAPKILMRGKGGKMVRQPAPGQEQEPEKQEEP